jgi:hypothetical protein
MRAISALIFCAAFELFADYSFRAGQAHVIDY